MKDSFTGKDIGCELESMSMKSAKEPLKGNKGRWKERHFPRTDSLRETCTRVK